MPTSLSSIVPLLGWAVLMLGCGRDAVGERVADLRSSDVETRRSAAQALGAQPHADLRAVAALAEAVSDYDADVRRLSIDALAAAGPAATSSLPALLKELDDDEPPIRLRAALAIQRIDPENSACRPVLTQAMRAADGRTLLAVGAMGADAEWAVPILIDLLSHELPQIRALAAATIGRIGPLAQLAKYALLRNLNDPHSAVRGASQRALDRIGEASPGATR